MEPEPGRRRATLLLWALALAFPVGALLLPSVWPARSRMPAIGRLLNAPIVLITASGLRGDGLGRERAGRAVTPALDRLAEQGVSFGLCYPASNQQVPAAAALLTGCCPATTGVRAEGEVLQPRLETLAERMAAAGYRTAAVVSNPALLGVGLEQGFGSFEARPGAAADDVVGAGLEQIRAAHDGPWLLWLDFSELLAPYGGPALDLAAFAPDAPADFGASADDYGLDDADLAARGWGPRELGWLAARYDAALARLDAAVGRLAAELEGINRLEMATLCVTSLRGERLEARPPYFTTGTDLSQDTLDVPLLLRLPAQTARGMRLARLAQGSDVAPTLCDLSLHGALAGATGRSLEPAFQSRTRVNRVVFAEGLVQLVAHGPLLPALAVYRAQKPLDFKTLLADDGRLLGAWKLAPGEDEGANPGLALNANQIVELKKVWREALGDRSDCLDRVR
ncbi:MAG TPA: sulfatase-like hydrolase/transferase [Planctomycetota bacterium]|nr:sulfatase-like hydrolase/transferase [Planctomycetota bacterium]